MNLHLRAPFPAITPERAAWTYLWFRWGQFAEPVREDSEDRELAILVIAGRIAVTAGDRRIEAGSGRASAFDGMPEAVYLPPRTAYTVEALEAGTDVAFCESLADPARCGPIAHVGVDDVAIEIRGSGNATRQINHILPPGFAAHRLLIVEVFTPAGSWSSFPPHKHDVLDQPGGGEPREVVLEEVYAYRISRPEGFGLQRVYTRDGELDEAYAVRDSDAVLVPRGYHPFAAAHGYDCYYLNALAGDVRSMAASDDPDLAWVREAWTSMQQDPRVPLVGGER
jgi:5-deoxy-glucuronate isomerase